MECPICYKEYSCKCPPLDIALHRLRYVKDVLYKRGNEWDLYNEVSESFDLIKGLLLHNANTYVDVFFGDPEGDPFVCAVYGEATIEILQQAIDELKETLTDSERIQYSWSYVRFLLVSEQDDKDKWHYYFDIASDINRLDLPIVEDEVAYEQEIVRFDDVN